LPGGWPRPHRGAAEPSPAKAEHVPRAKPAASLRRSRRRPRRSATSSTSRQGKALQRQVMRGVFGMLRKRF
jgi:hypothetical protein